MVSGAGGKREKKNCQVRAGGSAIPLGGLEGVRVSQVKNPFLDLAHSSLSRPQIEGILSCRAWARDDLKFPYMHFVAHRGRLCHSHVRMGTLSC